MDPSYAVGYLNGYWIKFIFKGARHCAQLQSTLQRRVGRHAVSSRRALNSCFGGQPRAAQKLELCSRPHAGRCTVPPVVIFVLFGRVGRRVILFLFSSRVGADVGRHTKTKPDDDN